MQSLATENVTLTTPDGVSLSTATVKKKLKELDDFFIPNHKIRTEYPPLGRGGFGIVRRAELLPSEGSQLGTETVAVKELMSDEWNIIPLRAAYRLAREMKVWAKCHHENILKFIGYHLGENFKPAYLVSEYMRNGNAKDYLARNKVDATGRLDLVRDTLSGLKYLHTLEKPIVHGDLKAANVLINDDLRGVLGDFGLAEVMGEPTDLPTSGEIKASTRWCSLEVLIGKSPRTPESDIWSWGCLVLEIMTGLHPYHEVNNVNVVLISLQNNKTPEPSPAPALPSPLLELLRACWSFEPKGRPDVMACMTVVDGLTRQKVPEVSFEPTDSEPRGAFTPNLNLLSEALAPLSHYFIPSQNIRFTKTLATGTYGYLNLAEMKSGNHEANIVVVRVLKAENWDIEPLRVATRLVREIKVWATYQHPNIAQLLGYYLSDDFRESYIVSEWMKNGNVRDYLAREQPGITVRMQLLRDVSEGLHYLHSRIPPLVHGDLIPGNVLIDDGARAVLSDFALAKLLQDTRTGFTTTGARIPYIRWLAPELVNEGGRKATPSDIWGWACLALTIIADEIPYGKMRTNPEIILEIATGGTPLPTPVPVSLNSLLPVLQNCWSVRPDERPDALACKAAVTSLI